MTEFFVAVCVAAPRAGGPVMASVRNVFQTEPLGHAVRATSRTGGVERIATGLTGPDGGIASAFGNGAFRT
ncbi:MAG: hypothetical protein AAF390_21515 [Pseudomonadota bacterium]